MKIVLSIFLFFLSLVFTLPVYAIVNPNERVNNKYGIGVIDENDYPSAAELVNASGDWGYITIVINDNDRNIVKWQKNFDLLRSLHLIPIVRLATHPEGDTWVKPKMEDAKSWTAFLGNLYWVTKNRYIVIFNEPNHTLEMGGDLNPKEYAQILATYATNLKETSDDFFILPAGMDASAPNGPQTMDEVDFLKSMLRTQPDIFTHIDGWTSHSYPNPGFSGKVTDIGRGTLRTYLWELDVLKDLGLTAKLPVFITETGWAHEEGLTINHAFYTSETISSFIKDTASSIWNDPNIVAITPFILNYKSYPFAHFSWAKPDGGSFYSFYDTYKNLAKVSGEPVLNTIFENIDSLALKNLNAISTAEIKTFKPEIRRNVLAGLFFNLFKL